MSRSTSATSRRWATTPRRVFELVYNELLIREELGERPDPDDYAATFPELAERLRLQLQVHEALSSDEFAAVAWPKPGESTSPPEPRVPGYRAARRDRPGGMGVVYQARQTQAHPPRGAEDDPRRPVRLRAGPAAVRQRGGAGRHAGPPQHRAHPRGRTARRAALLHHAVPDRRQPCRGPAPARRRSPVGGAAGGRGRGRRAPRAPAGHPAPRPQAGQHPARRGGPAACHRLRPGQAGPGGPRPDRHRRDHGVAGVHGARASHGRPVRGHHGVGRLRARRHPLRASDRPRAVRGELVARDDRTTQRRTAGAAVAAQPGGVPARSIRSA